MNLKQYPCFYLPFLVVLTTFSCLGASELTFDSSAQPATLVLNGVNRLGSSTADGFHLRYFDGEGYTDTLLGQATTVGDMVTVSESGGLPRFTFRIDEYDKHLSIHLVNVEGIPDDKLQAYGVYLKLEGNAKIGFKDLDDVIYSTGSDPVYLRWQHLWGSTLGGNRGGAALYNGTLDGVALDACLASIWANEDLPRPAGQTSWTEIDVLNWVENYRTNIVDLNEVILEASSPSELYNLTDTIAISNNARRVYLHCKTWRGEYWPKYNSRVHVNTNVFPAGAADLKVYSDYLAGHGIKLRLHNVSCGIGKHDPDYVVGTVDRRLASWGSGTLEEAVGPSESRLLFRPDADTKIPLLGINISHVGKRLYYNYIRIGEEIVRVGKLSRTEEEVWVLENCTRGFEGTDAFSHSSGSEMAGLYCSYGQNYIPEYDLDQTNSLLDELAFEYADFVNYLQLGHLHFDGPEIHDIKPWVIRELFDRIYSYVDHPTSSSRVGSAIAAHFEQDFSGIRDDLSLSYFALNVDIRLDEPTRLPATSRLDTHFHAQESIMVNGRRAFFSVPQSGYGITEEVMNNHGLFDEMNHLFGDWIKLAPVLHADDVAYVATVTTRTPGSNHYETEDVLVLGKNVSDKYTFTTHHVMGRSDGSDLPYKIEQEKGAVPRVQKITTGQTITVDNKKAAQALNFVISVDHLESASLVNPSIVTDNGSLSVTGTVAPGEYLYYYGGATAQRYDENWNLISNLPAVAASFTVSAGDNDITVNAGTGANVDLETQFIVLGNEYVLKTNDNL